MAGLAQRTRLARGCLSPWEGGNCRSCGSGRQQPRDPQAPVACLWCDAWPEGRLRGWRGTIGPVPRSGDTSPLVNRLAGLIGDPCGAAGGSTARAALPAAGMAQRSGRSPPPTIPASTVQQPARRACLPSRRANRAASEPWRSALARSSQPGLLPVASQGFVDTAQDRARAAACQPEPEPGQVHSISATSGRPAPPT